MYATFNVLVLTAEAELAKTGQLSVNATKNWILAILGTLF